MNYGTLLTSCQTSKMSHLCRTDTVFRRNGSLPLTQKLNIQEISRLFIRR